MPGISSSRGNLWRSALRAAPSSLICLLKVLSNAATRLLRRGVERNYLEMSEEVSGAKGRIEFEASLNLIARRSRKLSCIVDDLLPNTLANRIIRTSLERLSRVDHLDGANWDELTLLTRRFSFAQALRLDLLSFHRVQIHRNNFHYEFLMKLCELIFDCTLPVEGTGRFRFEDITRNEIKMRQCFNHSFETSSHESSLISR